MFSVLLRACSFAFIIVIGVFMRAKGMVSDEAGAVVKKILICITLPAAVITNFATIEEMRMDMMMITALAIVMNIMMIIVGVIMTKKKPKGEQAMNILCLPAYNIGAFCLPFVQSFLPALGVVTACMFDAGNSVMCTGGTYAFAAEYTMENKEKMDFKAFFQRLVTSPPLMTYVVMFTLSLFQLKMPQVVLTFIDPIAKANTFVAMLMLGLLFHLELKKDYISDIICIVVVRHIFAVLSAVMIYYFLPFDLVIRQALVLICFAPMSAVAPAYTGMCHGDEGKASAANSVTILCSLLTITGLIAWMGLKA